MDDCNVEKSLFYALNFGQVFLQAGYHTPRHLYLYTLCSAERAQVLEGTEVGFEDPFVQELPEDLEPIPYTVWIVLKIRVPLFGSFLYTRVRVLYWGPKTGP